MNTFFWISLFTGLEVVFIGLHGSEKYLHLSPLLIHFFLCFLLLFVWNRSHLDQRFFLPFILLTITLGPFGASTIFLAYVLYACYQKMTEPLSNLLASLIPQENLEASEIIYERIIYHLDSANPERVPIPFKDLMIFGTYEQKRMTIEKMLRYYRPDFASSLKLGLQDPSSAVKVQAATALGYIDHKMFEENMRLKDQLKNAQSDELLRQFANNTFEYVHAEVLDSDRRRKLITDAIDAYQKFLKLYPGAILEKYRLAKLFYLQKETELAKQIIENILEEDFYPDAALLYMKILYRLKEFDALNHFASFHNTSTQYFDPLGELSDALKVWRQD